MAPPTVSHVCCGGCHLWLKCQAIPGDDGVPGKADRVTMPAQARPAGENEGALFVCAAKVKVMQVIKPEKWIQAGSAGLSSLLPVYPPKIDTQCFLRMMEIRKIGFCEVRIGNIKCNGITFRGVLTQLFCHRGIGILVRVDTFSGVEVQSSLQPTLVKLTNKQSGVRKKLPVPRITCPS